MHVKGFAFAGGGHQLFAAFPIPVLGVLSQKLLFQGVDAVEITFAIQVGALFHGAERGPALGIDDVGALKGFGHGVGFAETASVPGGVVPSNGLHFRHHFVSLGMRQNDIHAEAGHQTDNALGNRKGFAVGRAVSPGHGQLFAVEVIRPAKIV